MSSTEYIQTKIDIMSGRGVPTKNAQPLITCVHCKVAKEHGNFSTRYIEKKRHVWVPKKTRRPVCMECKKTDADRMLEVIEAKKRDVERKLLDTGEWENMLDITLEEYCIQEFESGSRSWKDENHDTRGCLFKDDGNQTWQQIRAAMKNFLQELEEMETDNGLLLPSDEPANPKKKRHGGAPTTTTTTIKI